MRLLDLNDLGDTADCVTELCIIGSGPAGLALAAEFAHGSVRVLVVESGGREPEPEAAALNAVDSVGATRVEQQELMRTRALGGTSRIWTGRCAELDDVDFAARAWVPHSGWPIGAADLRPYLDRARAYLGLGPNTYDETLWPVLGAPRPAPALDPTLLTPRFWQFSRGTREPWGPARFAADVVPTTAPNVDVLLHATATHIDTNAEGTAVEAVEVAAPGGRRTRIRAKAFILATGGLENARLLLASNRIWPAGVGNGHDLVGRFLMDHPGGVIASVPPAAARRLRSRFGRYWLDGPAGRQVYLHGLALSPDVQEKEGLLNCAAFLEEYPTADDPWHAGQRLVAALKRQEPSPDQVELASFWRRDDDGGIAAAPSALRDALAIARHAPSVAAGAYRIVRQHRPPVFRAGQVDLYCLTEQVPDPSSRLTLSDRADAFGVPLPRVDWKIGERERESMRRLVELLDGEFGRVGYPRPKPATWLGGGADWRDSLTDRAHPIGTTRMSATPRDGVVDRHGQVHGVAGLFVAGSSTFPTAGHANPTLTIVALAIRMADRLKAECFSASGSASGSSAPGSSAPGSSAPGSSAPGSSAPAGPAAAGLSG
ncbi:MAG: GMC oxidoreductase [Frankia sp.]